MTRRSQPLNASGRGFFLERAPAGVKTFAWDDGDRTEPLKARRASSLAPLEDSCATVNPSCRKNLGLDQALRKTPCGASTRSSSFTQPGMVRLGSRKVSVYRPAE